MFTPSLCRYVGEFPECGYGPHKRTHELVRSSCHFCKKKKYYSFKSRFAPDKLKYSNPYFKKKSKYNSSKKIPHLKKRASPLKRAIY